MRDMLRRASVPLLLVILIIGTLAPPAAVIGQEPIDPFVAGLMERMSPTEKVGQLFLVTFIGGDVGPDSDIARLISEYRVGGAMLLASKRGAIPKRATMRPLLKLDRI